MFFFVFEDVSLEHLVLGCKAVETKDKYGEYVIHALIQNDLNRYVVCPGDFRYDVEGSTSQLTTSNFDGFRPRGFRSA
jgi:hypothetical protein